MGVLGIALGVRLALAQRPPAEPGTYPPDIYAPPASDSPLAGLWPWPAQVTTEYVTSTYTVTKSPQNQRSAIKYR